MDEFKLKIGDVGVLKSGGPSMTVVATGSTLTDELWVHCFWFNDETVRREGRFPPAALKQKGA